MQQRLTSAYWAGVGIFLTSCCLSLSASDSFAATTSQSAVTVKQTLQKLYAAQDAAALRKDSDGVFATYSPDFVLTDFSGRTENLASAKSHFASLAAIANSIKMHSLVQSATLSGKTAVATMKLHGVLALPNPQSGGSVILGIDALSHDTWVKTAAGWRETASVTVSEQDTFNGKPLPNTVYVNPPAATAPAPTPAAPDTATPAAPAPNQPAAPAPPADTSAPPAAPAAPPSTAAKGS